MKIKEVCRYTGLTDRTVRYYMECGLLSVHHKESYTGRKNFTFTREDIERLEIIKTLRAAGFRIEQIKQMQNGDAVKDCIHERLQELEQEREKKERLIEALRKADIDRYVSEEELVIILLAHLEEEEEPMPVIYPSRTIPAWAVVSVVTGFLIGTLAMIGALLGVDFLDFQRPLIEALCCFSILMVVRKTRFGAFTVGVTLCTVVLLPTMIGAVIYRPKTLDDTSYDIIARVTWHRPSYFTAYENWETIDGQAYFLCEEYTNPMETTSETWVMPSEGSCLEIDMQTVDIGPIRPAERYKAYKDVYVYESVYPVYATEFHRWIGYPVGVARHYEIIAEDRLIVAREYNYESVGVSYFEEELRTIDPVARADRIKTADAAAQ